MDLKCRKLDCKNNKEYACCCKGITVQKNCECGSYEKGKNLPKEQKQDPSKDMFEVAPEVYPYRHNKDINIDCKAKCLFNNECQCVANGICVCDDGKGATCVTFIEP